MDRRRKSLCKALQKVARPLEEPRQTASRTLHAVHAMALTRIVVWNRLVTNAVSRWARRVRMAQIFLSYSRDVQVPASQLAQDLKNLGHVVWLDQELTGGQAWWDQILARIQAADLFVFVLSSLAWYRAFSLCLGDVLLLSRYSHG
ncbi:MAG: toll/interleukin-1 receptor domain-containing protein [Cyanobacteriota bacterium]|nr:toll/interleukin-1 receptor domain-containing protein [Cyanobacteriota bacterium]